MGWNVARCFTTMFLSVPLIAFAQWGGGFGGFGGDQNSSSQIEISEKFADLNYANDGKTFHNLDIYLPKEIKESYPVVIHTYGSAWSMNNQKGSADLGTICNGFLKAGFAVVTPNHRSASDAVYPAQLHDLKAVVRFIRGNAAKYKIDTNFIAMSGFSSGGHLSSLTATTCGMKEGSSGSVTVDLEGDLGEFTSFSSCVDAACLWSPPTDIYTMNPIKGMGNGTFEGAFVGVEREGNQDKWMVASSPYYVDENDPPIILFHGTSDNIVNIEQSQELYDSLQKYNVVSEFVKVSGGSHGGSEMYVSENLDKAVNFFKAAIESKASSESPVSPPDEIVSDSLPVADTTDVKKPADSVSVVDTVVVDDGAEIPQDSSTTSLQVSNKMPVPVGIYGNVLRMIYPTSNQVKYRVLSVDGTYTESGEFLNEVDLSYLRSGVYCVVVKTATARHMLRFVKK